MQWADKLEKQNSNGKIEVVRYVSITFPEGTFEGVKIDASCEEDCIVKGEVNDAVTGEKGSRISDIRKKYPKSGLIRSVKDNSDRTYLKNLKVVVA